MHTKTRTPGQVAYDLDCQRCPFYAHGDKRASWSELTDVARWSWERNPTPRAYTHESLRAHECRTLTDYPDGTLA